MAFAVGVGRCVAWGKGCGNAARRSSGMLCKPDNSIQIAVRFGETGTAQSNPVTALSA